ncbi:exodeoxyribonuclease V subunit beta [Salinivibrio proteolyticus]|uniref:RecBCD enzyme subunit RecB n=1 Tax=Salinivibrio proteolyticus TaxID=334715 RepID=A0ABY7LDM0_9GAMM|nr:exodeoxyribonuclease V subunit beta [Salinivibrio proteolyticus]WBA15334.1 exodeoxyribonuclease V subunit beta [Salinivibrio proteolyticus]
MEPQILNPLTLPLDGVRLIEASAGTGKTFTIAGLYLRLLLGHGRAAPCRVEQILVVTFTEAATQELKDRIRRRIHEARFAFMRGESDDPIIEPLLAEISDHKTAAQRLLEAERQMDEAAIYTIHGFCQRMLTQNAFESGSLFSHEFVTDERQIKARAAADFWRRRFYPLPKSLAGVVSSYWPAPEALLKEIAPYLSGPAVTVKAPDLGEDLTAAHQAAIAKIDGVKRAWREAGEQITEQLSAAKLDGRSYRKDHLANWLNAMEQWANAETLDYQLPDKLEKFAQQTLAAKSKAEPPSLALFDQIQALVDQPPTLKPGLTALAIKEVRQLLRQEKRRQGWLSFDDLLSQLASALDQDSQGQLAARIRSLYPVAMIDEFQDTDPLQYQIFSTVYQPPVADDAPVFADAETDTGEEDERTGLMMIGDPKQAIYAFRGADIFTYIHARAQVSDHYNLATNWRSTDGMVRGVNALFSRAKAPFVYQDSIPFLEVASSPSAKQKALVVEGNEQPALTFWHHSPDELCAKQDFEQTLAVSTAQHITQVLNQSMAGNSYLQTPSGRADIQPHNIAVLVRTGREAQLVKQALAEKGVASVYLSNRDNVFASPVASDIERILVAVMQPENERKLRAALASPLFGLTAEQLALLNQDEALWEQEVVAFSHYRDTWQRRGVMPMLRQVASARQVAENWLAMPQGERCVTDFLHIAELLQSASQQLDNPHALIRWLQERMAEPAQQSEEQQVRLESERDLVQIVTIHKSKGLEYDLVYLPFACQYRESSQPFYHDEQYQPVLALDNVDEGKERAEKERLAEDIRLLYVAVTRAVYGCFIGCAPLKQGNSRQKDSALHLTALGYLLQHGEAGDASLLAESLAGLASASDAVAVVAPPEPDDSHYAPQTGAHEALSARQFDGKIDRQWRLTSYSGLLKQSHHISALPTLASYDLDADDDLADEETADVAVDLWSVFAFPKGARAGTFLHTLFEEVDFTADLMGEEVAELITHHLSLENYDPQWCPILQQWMTQVLKHPLNEQGLRLNQIDNASRLTEMEFVMPLAALDCQRLNRLAARYDALSARAGQLTFETARGMLKGFIDLTFRADGKYYVLDWKSNHLGDSVADYHPDALKEAMIAHRYDFQYQIYTLALHRFLRQRIPDYDYDTHVGGVFYFFLRGASDSGETGVFAHRPDKALIDALDNLFAGESV